MERNAYTVKEFCTVHSISRGTFYQLLKAGNGPKFFKVGRKTLVSVAAAERWLKQMEAKAPARLGPEHGSK